MIWMKSGSPRLEKQMLVGLSPGLMLQVSVASHHSLDGKSSGILAEGGSIIPPGFIGKTTRAGLETLPMTPVTLLSVRPTSPQTYQFILASPFHIMSSGTIN